MLSHIFLGVLLFFTGQKVAKTLETPANIVMFDVVDLSGLKPTNGSPFGGQNAYDFPSNASDLVAPSNVSSSFVKNSILLREFTVMANLRVADGENGGTIVFLSNPDRPNRAGFAVTYNWNNNVPQVGVSFLIRGIPESSFCVFGRNIPKNEWVHLEVRMYMDERLARCRIEVPSGKKYYRYTGIANQDRPIDAFHPNGDLRLAQQYLSGDEYVFLIRERFVGKLQDVIISFGQPNCTYIIEQNIAKSTPAPVTCPTNNVPKDDDCVDANGNQRNNMEKWQEGNLTECSCDKGRIYCVKSVKSCTMKGKRYKDGDKWDNLDNCNFCECKDDTVICSRTIRTLKNDGCEWKCGDCTSGECPREKKRRGCFCPNKRIFSNGRCIYPIACPCKINGREFTGTLRSGCSLLNCQSGISSEIQRVFC
ncbi:uncharacterized protein LOC124447570 isoform X2 [Xenia sp. Carnegie-2017]|uniref:uncharacterized protein LOC124447570 isoform X2 n=1 Tax=Xenia sp. Carnegie-2017 TaxID=2897299 RepID=UPI001F047601|nr:uncharacterized protein LOC124447570 isoform X2 [Xenia sp. Carnegie-2017]